MDLISDGLLLAAAITAIFYCVAINRRLGTIKRQSADLTAKLVQFDETVSRVEKLIAEGRDLAKSEDGRLQELCGRADTLRSDLRRAVTAFEKSQEDLLRTRSPETGRDKEEPLARIKRLQGRDLKRSAS